MDKINFLAFLLPIAFFLYFECIGYAALSILRSQRQIIQNLLLAPAIGIAITLLPLFWLSCIGIPIKDIALPLTLLLLLLSLSILWWKKPLFPLKQYLPFGGILVLALILTGRPLLEFGFNWISYGNDDMVNYCLGAVRFLNHGYFEPPDINTLTGEKDYSLFYWFFHVPALARSGCELMLAWASHVTTLSPLQVFMPTILAFYLSLISTTSALLYQGRVFRLPALAGSFLLACSALTSLGVFYQLIAQMAGLTLFLAALVLLLNPFTQHQRYDVFRQAALISVVVASLFIFYYEIIVFLASSFILYILIHLLQRKKMTYSFLYVLAVTILFVSLELNVYLVNIVALILHLILKNPVSSNPAIFPYFLEPKGFSCFWGFQGIATNINRHLQPIAILAGICLFVTNLVFTLLLLRRHIAAIATLVMFIFLFIFFKQQNAFALFKLAMYIQPLLLSVIAIAIFHFIQNRKVQIIFVLLLAASGLYGQNYYLERSRGEPGNFVELPYASQTGLTQELKILGNNLPYSHHFIVDTPNKIAAKILAMSLEGKETAFYSRAFLVDTICISKKETTCFGKEWLDVGKKLIPSTIHLSEFLTDHAKQKFQQAQFSFPNGKSHFVIPISKPEQESDIIIASPLRSAFNRMKFPREPESNFTVLPWQNAKNVIVFINSSLGQDYYFGDPLHISLYNLESDYFYKNKSVARIGKNLLFRLINPSSKVRFVLNVSTSVLPVPERKLPSANALGSTRTSFPLLGQGSARVFSPPFTPKIIQGEPYAALTLKNDTETPPSPIYLRDLSLISEEEYKKMTPPSSISHFPDDLSSNNLAYSGIYEDGWVGEKAYLQLKQPEKYTTLVIAGEVPLLNHAQTSSHLTIFLEDKKLTQKILPSGPFLLSIPLSDNKARRMIKLHASNMHVVSAEDQRPVTVKLFYVGFKKD